jgi:catechol 2,3-dioxygenase-like lactoylglutathione lyase family enzyme
VGIREVVVQVADVAAAVDFYRSIGRFRLVRTVEHDGSTIAELDADGTRVTLVPAQDPGAWIVLTTEDAEGERAGLAAAGVEADAVEAPDGVWLPFTDPWGNRLGFWQDRSGG